MSTQPQPASRMLLALHRASPYLLAILFAVGIVALYKARLIVLVTLIGLGLGILITPLVGMLHRRTRLPRGAWAALVGVFILATAAVIGYLTIHLVANQLDPLLETLPEKLASLQQSLSKILENVPFFEKRPQGADLPTIVRNTLGQAFQSVQMTLVAVGLFIYGLALGIYVSISPLRYKNALLSMMPAYARPGAGAILDASATELRHWFLAQLVSMAFVGMLTALGLWLIGLQQWPVLGALTAVLEFIPYAGPILAAFLACLLTLISDPSMVPWVLVIFIGIQQIESNVITPLILKKGVSLPPVHLLFIGTILGSLFGLLGFFLAAPFLTIVRSIYLRTIARQMDRMTEPSGGDSSP